MGRNKNNNNNNNNSDRKSARAKLSETSNKCGILEQLCCPVCLWLVIVRRQMLFRDWSPVSSGFSCAEACCCQRRCPTAGQPFLRPVVSLVVARLYSRRTKRLLLVSSVKFVLIVPMALQSFLCNISVIINLCFPIREGSRFLVLCKLGAHPACLDSELGGRSWVMPPVGAIYSS